jgi:hypothetical protein
MEILALKYEIFGLDADWLDGDSPLTSPSVLILTQRPQRKRRILIRIDSKR